MSHRKIYMAGQPKHATCSKYQTAKSINAEVEKEHFVRIRYRNPTQMGRRHEQIIAKLKLARMADAQKEERTQIVEQNYALIDLNREVLDTRFSTRKAIRELNLDLSRADTNLRWVQCASTWTMVKGVLRR